MTDESRIKLTQEKCDEIMDYLKLTFPDCGIILVTKEVKTGFIHSITNLANFWDRRQTLEAYMHDDYSTNELERAV